MSDEPLDEIRKTIDQLDDTIVKALGERQNIVRKVISGKLDRSTDIRDPKREEELLEKIRARAPEYGLDPFFLEQLFREIIQHSVRFQTHALVDHQNEKAKYIEAFWNIIHWQEVSRRFSTVG